jgi:Cell division protein CrgA
VPKSRVRKKSVYTPPVGAISARKKYGSPLTGPAMATMFVIGVIWLVVYYLDQGGAPIPGIAAWNLLIGFGFLIGGFVLATRWK